MKKRKRIIITISIFAFLVYLVTQTTIGKDVIFPIIFDDQGGEIIGAGDVSSLSLSNKYNQAVEIKGKYQLAANSLTMEAKGDPKDRIEVIVGRQNSQKFTPNVQFSRWDEVYFNLIPNLRDIPAEDKILSFDNDEIKFNTSKISFRMYDYTEGEGGYKYIWYLDEKPATNKVEFAIESSGLNFYYQPSFNQQYQDGYSEEFQKEIIVSETQIRDLDGNVLAERPENVVGSYAVYHSTKGRINDKDGKDYKVGKVFHIYRPHIIDAEGRETWGILKIGNGIYSVEIPQEFLDTAVYPIKSNDTFGYTSVGGSYAGANRQYYNHLGTWGDDTAAISGTVTTIYAYSKSTFDGDETFEIGVYDESGGEANNLIGSDTTAGISGGGWASKDVSAQNWSIAQGDDYYAACCYVGCPSSPVPYDDNLTGATLYYASGGSLDDPWDTTGDTPLSDKLASFYVEYEAADSSSVSNKIKGGSLKLKGKTLKIK